MEASEVAKLETAVRQLWPAIRFFGVCGAAPQYVEAAISIGKLIGEIKEGELTNTSELVQQSASTARHQTIDGVLQFIAESPNVRGLTGRSGQEKLKEAIEDYFLGHGE